MKYLNFLISLFIYIYFKISINEFSAINNAHISPPTLIFLGGGGGLGLLATTSQQHIYYYSSLIETL